MNLLSLSSFLARPGVQTSEFRVLLAVTAWLGVNAGTHTVSVLQALIVAAPGVVYAVARGLTKTETRPTISQPPVVPPAA